MYFFFSDDSDEGSDPSSPIHMTPPTSSDAEDPDELPLQDISEHHSEDEIAQPVPVRRRVGRPPRIRGRGRPARGHPVRARGVGRPPQVQGGRGRQGRAPVPTRGHVSF